jgi:UrcA family protein
MKLSFIMAAALTLFPVAHAQSAVESVTVKFADLDLNTDQGDRALYRRLTAAARRACWQFPAAAEPSPISRQKQLEARHATCVQQAIDGAVAQINRPTFTSYVASRQMKVPYQNVARNRAVSTRAYLPQ